MNKTIKNIAILTLALILVVTSGCSAPKSAGLTDQEVTSLTANMLQALDANDYPRFSQDFSEQMGAVFTQDEFTKVQAMLHTASGKYVDISAPTLTNNQGFAIYRIPAKYENEIVYVTITFLVGGNKVEGLFFDSVNLRKLPK